MPSRTSSRSVSETLMLSDTNSWPGESANALLLPVITVPLLSWPVVTWTVRKTTLTAKLEGTGTGLTLKKLLLHASILYLQLLFFLSFSLSFSNSLNSCDLLCDSNQYNKKPLLFFAFTNSKIFNSRVIFHLKKEKKKKEGRKKRKMNQKN